jgi:hypothetical protein
MNKVYYENGIKITRIPEKKRKNNIVIKTKFHQKARRSNNNDNGPSTKVVSGIYGNNTQHNGKIQHRGFNPLAAQKNKACENY